MVTTDVQARSKPVGLVAALSAVLLKVGAGWLGAWRAGIPPATSSCTTSSRTSLGCSLTAERWHQKRGSGIQRQTTLCVINLSWRVALVKLTHRAGFGLTLGRQDQLCMWELPWRQLSRWFTSPDHRRQMIAAGAGARLAALQCPSCPVCG